MIPAMSLFWLLAIPVMSAATDPQAATKATDPRPIVERMLRNLGGVRAPYQVESIAFTFAVESDGAVKGDRHHVWHPRSGRHELRFERDGERHEVDWNLNSRSGVAARGGVPLVGAELAAELESAHAAWVNDTYWLLMPYKVVDPGVWLDYDGEVTIEGRTYDKIRLTFEGVGLTPGDTYWLFVARENGLPERWSFVLEGREPPPVEWQWTDWSMHGPLLVARRKQRIGADQAILTRNIQVVE